MSKYNIYECDLRTLRRLAYIHDIPYKHNYCKQELCKLLIPIYEKGSDYFEKPISEEYEPFKLKKFCQICFKKNIMVSSLGFCGKCTANIVNK